MTLEKNWRWFGPHDPVTLPEIRQTGVSGIVTALHHIPVGTTWTTEEILKRKKIIESGGLKWSVAESLPVHEDIKKRRGNYRQFIDNYKESIRNLGQQGIDTVCYNFMPVLDWSRTDLRFVFRDGSITTKFETKVFAAFDLFILRRPDAANNYNATQIDIAREYYKNMTDKQKKQLTETILLGLPGSLEAYSLNDFRTAIAEYKAISDDDLRENLCSFIREIMPAAEAAGIHMAIHPDDPPWSLLGLPRIVSTKQDIEQIIRIVDSPLNGFALCTGSFGASIKNDLIDMTKTLGHRINFTHLRNITRNSAGDFTEDLPLEGDIDLYSVLKALLMEQKRRIDSGRHDTRMPMRPDHGHLMIIEQDKAGIYPGYSLLGRLRNLSEIRGLEEGILRATQLKIL